MATHQEDSGASVGNAVLWGFGGMTLLTGLVVARQRVVNPYRHYSPLLPVNQEVDSAAIGSYGAVDTGVPQLRPSIQPL